MFEKRAVILAASAGASNTSVIRTIKNSLFYWGVPYIKSYGIAVLAKNWNMVKEDKKTKIEKDMAMMHKSGWDSPPVEKEYWDKRGWLKSGRPWKNRSDDIFVKE